MHLDIRKIRSCTKGLERILSLVQLKYEAYNRKKFTHSITLQPPVADQVFMPHMKAMFVPFHMGYGSLISYQRL